MGQLVFQSWQKYLFGTKFADASALIKAKVNDSYVGVGHLLS